MKKIIITLIVFVLTTNDTQSMDIVLHQSTNQIQTDKAKYNRAARAFLLYMPNWSLNHTFETFKKLENPTRALVLDRIAETNNPLFLLITVPKDIFVATMQTIIPKYEIKRGIQLGDSQFTEYRNGYPAHKTITLHPVPPAQDSGIPVEMTPTHQAQHKLFTLNTIEAFNVLSSYTNQEQITIEDLVEDPSNAKDSSLSHNFGYYDDGDLTRSYGLSLDDYIKTTTDQRELLKKIARGHNAGKYGDANKRYKMTREDIELLLPIKDIINQNDLYKYLQIGIDFPAKTTYETTKDLLLFAIPLAITESVVPQAIHYNIHKPLQGVISNVVGYGIDSAASGVIGSTISYGSGFAIGKWIFPLFDWGNSDASKIRKWFGKQNKTVVEKRWSFAALSLFHFITHTVAQNLLSLQTFSYQALGYTIHGMRLLSYACGVFDIKSYVKRSSLLGTFADIFHLKKYKHPLNRRNKDDKSYTLGDLLNAQTN